jgi:hypothetical protein
VLGLHHTALVFEEHLSDASEGSGVTGRDTHSAISQAIGVLLDRGHMSDSAGEELRRLAAVEQGDLVDAAEGGATRSCSGWESRHTFRSKSGSQSCGEWPPGGSRPTLAERVRRDSRSQARAIERASMARKAFGSNWLVGRRSRMRECELFDGPADDASG